MTHPTADDFRRVLERHVIGVWFPRSLDTEHGGFLCDFDRTWKPVGPHDKLLEFQARHLVFAAEAYRLLPHDERLRAAMTHGMRYLVDVMWDADGGGWFHRLDRAGRPLEGETKHVHGAAYAIQACCAVYEATGDADALDHARAGFDWMERHAHDDCHGGYYGFLTRDGSLIREATQWKAPTDPTGTLIGLKDTNVHCDLLETLSCLHRVWPVATVEARLRELVEFFCSGSLVSQGDLHYFFEPDWTPIPGIINYGYQFQAVFRLLLTRGQLGGDVSVRIESVARSLMDRALERAHDRRNGGYFAYAEPGPTPPWLRHVAALARTKPWWVQTEILKAALALSRVEPRDDRYCRRFAEQWEYFRGRFIDERHGGTFTNGFDGSASLKLFDLAALRPRVATRKGSDWKDASHDGRAWIYCISALP